MTFSATQFRNSIRLVECEHGGLCCGFRWEIADEEALAQLVAWMMQGHYLHAERVLQQLHVVAPVLRLTVQQQAIRYLTLPANTGNVPVRWHRDGLLFQHISWLAAQLHAGGRMATSMPHLRPANKGFDALLIPLNEQRAALSGLYICEDKASENPRNQITQKVWPEIKSIEAGERDAELIGEISTILRVYNVTNVEEVLADICWLNNKAYRVSLAVSPSEDHADARQRLFLGYEEIAPGHTARRRAETLRLHNLRNWMDAFAALVVKIIQTS